MCDCATLFFCLIGVSAAFSCFAVGKCIDSHSIPKNIQGLNIDN
jgi:hypothetical protein